MSRLMGIRELFISTAVITLLGITACGDDDDPAGAAGNAGTAGRGGSSGTAGSSGSSGAAGTNGSSGAAGAGGTSGAAGSGGSSGAAGTDAGDSSAGTGGSAGSDAGDEGGGDAGPTPLELELLKTLSPLPAVPADTTNRVADSAAAAALGQKLFFDQNFSGPMQIDNDLGTTGQSGKVSCASCHSSSYMDDARSMPRTVSQGTGFHTRNSPTTINASFYKWIGWGGRFAAQWELPIAVVESPVIMNGNRLKVAHRIFDVYKAEYEAVFSTTLEPELANTTRFPADGKPKPAPTQANPNPPDGPWEQMTDPDRLIVNTILANYGKAIAAYMRLLVSRDAPFDSWVSSNATNSAIDAAAARGAKLFVGKARCISCHSGPHFSDDKFHNIGVPQTGERVPATDDGRAVNATQLLGTPFNVNGAFSDDTNTGRLAGLTNPMPADTKGAFRTPGLRGVALTAPYMHSGQIATLEEVVDFYNHGGGVPPTGQTKDNQVFPLGLTSGEQADLVAFLKTLTGKEIPPALLVDSTP